MTREPRTVIFDFGGVLVDWNPRHLSRRLLERYRVDPARAVFIDDSSNNVDVAAALGIHAIQFRSPPALRDELTALGVLA